MGKLPKNSQNFPNWPKSTKIGQNLAKISTKKTKNQAKLAKIKQN